MLFLEKEGVFISWQLNNSINIGTTYRKDLGLMIVQVEKRRKYFCVFLSFFCPFSSYSFLHDNSTIREEKLLPLLNKLTILCFVVSKMYEATQCFVCILLPHSKYSIENNPTCSVLYVMTTWFTSYICNKQWICMWRGNLILLYMHAINKLFRICIHTHTTKTTRYKLKNIEQTQTDNKV